MHVSVQKFTSTTRPRSSAGPSGSEFSHPVAPSNAGTRLRSNTAIRPRYLAATAGGGSDTLAASRYGVREAVRTSSSSSGGAPEADSGRDGTDGAADGELIALLPEKPRGRFW